MRASLTSWAFAISVAPIQESHTAPMIALIKLSFRIRIADLQQGFFLSGLQFYFQLKGGQCVETV
jgi:hypothetical protein